jgi:hypothetical protein
MHFLLGFLWVSRASSFSNSVDIENGSRKQCGSSVHVFVRFIDWILKHVDLIASSRFCLPSNLCLIAFKVSALLTSSKIGHRSCSTNLSERPNIRM